MMENGHKKRTGRRDIPSPLMILQVPRLFRFQEEEEGKIVHLLQ
jgi:hypothetical protein